MTQQTLLKMRTHFVLGQRLCCHFAAPRDFRPKKALVLGKVSRYQFEKMRHRGLNESELQKALVERGSNPEVMRQHHEIHENSQTNLIRALERRGVQVKQIQRFDYTDDILEWADVVFTAGGDGTFLMGASKILNPLTPIVGINTDPTRSAGYLCLPKQFSVDPELTVEKIMTGSFTWSLRKRLRTTLLGDKERIWEPALELHSQKLKYPEYRYVELVSEKNTSEGPDDDHPFKDQPVRSKKKQPKLTSWHTSKSVRKSEEEEDTDANETIETGQRTLPVLALNEIYVGESLSSRVSYLEVKFDDEEFHKTRNSGICISTGTGSTSWTFNICKLTELSVKSVIEKLNEIKGQTVIDLATDKELVKEITKRFNNDLAFKPDERKMAYTIRDPVFIGKMHGDMDKVSRGLTERMEVKSRCFDACLVIDGGLSYNFNDGTKAIIEMVDDDDLRTLVLH